MGWQLVRGMGVGWQGSQPVSLRPQVTSNLGKLILKEEMEKSLPIRRKTRSLPDRTPFHTCEWDGSPWILVLSLLISGCLYPPVPPKSHLNLPNPVCTSQISPEPPKSCLNTPNPT